MCNNATCAIGGIISFPIGHHKRTYKLQHRTRRVLHSDHWLSLALYQVVSLSSLTPLATIEPSLFSPEFCHVSVDIYLP